VRGGCPEVGRLRVAVPPACRRLKIDPLKEVAEARRRTSDEEEESEAEGQRATCARADFLRPSRSASPTIGGSLRGEAMHFKPGQIIRAEGRAEKYEVLEMPGEGRTAEVSWCGTRFERVGGQPGLVDYTTNGGP